MAMEFDFGAYLLGVTIGIFIGWILSGWYRRLRGGDDGA